MDEQIFGTFTGAVQKGGIVGILSVALFFVAKLWMQERRERLQLQALVLSITTAKFAELPSKNAPAKNDDIEPPPLAS